MRRRQAVALPPDHQQVCRPAQFRGRVAALRADLADAPWLTAAAPTPSGQAWAPMGGLCHNHGMSRTRLSTTVDAGLLDGARRVRWGITDAALIDDALGALLARHRATEVDASYVAYDEHPLDEQDEWGDLASFREAAAGS